MDNNMLALIIVGMVFIIGFCMLFVKGCQGCQKPQVEEFGAVPKNIITSSGYHFHDHGLGTHLYQVDWTKGAFFQPWIALDQGLYSSKDWSPRFIKGNLQNQC